MGVALNASHIIGLSERRLESVAQNIANAATFGYKSERTFSSLVDGRTGLPQPVSAVDFSDGRLTPTGNQFDFALLGPGFFVLRRDEAPWLTRQGRFERNDEGQLIGAGGAILQLAGGGDALVDTGEIEVFPDGVLLARGRPVGRLAIADVGPNAAMAHSDRNLFALPESGFDQIDRPDIRQGMLETSNVSLGAEMTEMMDAIRLAQTGQRLIQTYDALMGRAISVFGGSAQ